MRGTLFFIPPSNIPFVSVVARSTESLFYFTNCIFFVKVVTFTPNIPFARKQIKPLNVAFIGEFITFVKIYNYFTDEYILPNSE